MGDGGCAEKRSAFSLAAAPGPRRHWRRRWVRLCLPGGGPGHGALWPKPLGLRTGLGAARRRPALTAVPCPAPGGAEAERGRPDAFRMLIKEYHILLPMSLDEYQVAQLYMIQVRAVGSGRPMGAILHDGVRAGERRPHLGQAAGPGSTTVTPAPGLERAQRPEEEREVTLRMGDEAGRAVGKGAERLSHASPTPTCLTQAGCSAHV